MTHGTSSLWMRITTFFAGLVTGVSAGLLLAPQSGARTRRQLHNLAQNIEEQTDHFVCDAKTSIGKLIEHGKGLVG